MPIPSLPVSRQNHYKFTLRTGPKRQTPSSSYRKPSIHYGEGADQAIPLVDWLGSLHVRDSILDEIHLAYTERSIAELRGVDYENLPSQAPHASTCQSVLFALIACDGVSKVVS